MHDHRDEEKARPSSSPEPGQRAGGSQLLPIEEVGDLHFESSSYAAAEDYYRAALAELLPREHAEPRDRARLHLKLSDCLRRREALEEAEGELDASLEQLSRVPDATAADRGRLHARRALILTARGDYAAAVEVARAAFASLAASSYHLEVGMTQSALGNCHVRLGMPAKAEEFYQDALATYRRIELRRPQIHILLNLGTLAKNACRWGRALQLYERAERLCRECGASYHHSLLHLNRAVLYRKMGRRAEALADAERGLKLAESMGEQARIGKYRLLLGQLALDQGRLAHAELQLLEGRVIAERCGAQREQALADEFMGDLMAARGQHAEAEANYEQAEGRALQISEHNDILAEVLRRRAMLALSLGSATEACELARRGLVTVDHCKEEFERPYLRRILGDALRQLGRGDEARSEYEGALLAFRASRLPAEITETLERLADFHEESGGRENLLLARAHVQEALSLDLDNARTSPCGLQLRLARLELELGNCDEALLALFELERLSCSLDGAYDREAESLRADIERAMARQARSVADQVQFLADLPDLVGDEELPASKGIASVLQTIAERLGAQRAFVALERAERVEIVCDLNCADAAKKLAAHALSILRDSEAAPGPRVFSRSDEDAAWRDAELGPAQPHRSAVLFPVGSGVEIVGVVYLDSAAERGLSFDAESLAMASTYIHLVQGTLLDELRARKLRRADSGEPAFEHVITSSDKVLDVLRLCSKVAPSSYTVLFSGETGVGKGLLAKTIHDLSPRREEALVSVNCAAIPETLLESELFGHKKGSFTGADRDRIGLIESAHGGSLFLDEVGKMSLPMQAKLLHFLDTRELRPVGDSTVRTVDVRVICASKRDLKSMVDQGEFLEDLYYRLLDFPIEVPPLRERGDDALLLARHYIAKSADELGRPTPKMTRNFAQRLSDYAWPGNVRELEKVIKRACILSADDDRLRETHLPDELLRGRRRQLVDGEIQDARSLRDQIAALERRVLQSALDRSGWNRSQVARELKISYPTLLQKIRLYDLNPLS